MLGMTAVKELISKSIYSGEKWKLRAENLAKKWFDDKKNKRWKFAQFGLSQKKMFWEENL